MAKLKAEFKAKWLAALRSGEYTQTREALWRHRDGHDSTRPAGMCCIGVACEILRQDDPTLFKWSKIDPDYNGIPTQESANTGLPPKELLLHMFDDTALVIGQLQECWDTPIGFLPSLNDSGKTFAELADIIEQHM